MGYEADRPRLSDELLEGWSVPALEKYIEDKSLDIKGHKDHGRVEDAEVAQHFLDQAAAALALKQAGVKVA